MSQLFRENWQRASFYNPQLDTIVDFTQELGFILEIEIMCEIHIGRNFVTSQWSQKIKFDFQFEGWFWINIEFSKYM